MSRHGYSSDHNDWETIKYRGRVASATRGKRGQTLFRELLAALDAMPEKELISGQLVSNDGDCCAIGSLLLQKEPPYLDELRGVDDQWVLADWNPEIAEDLDVPSCLIDEIEYENDHWAADGAARWRRMRAWVARQIDKQSVQTGGTQ